MSCARLPSSFGINYSAEYYSNSHGFENRDVTPLHWSARKLSGFGADCFPGSGRCREQDDRKPRPRLGLRRRSLGTGSGPRRISRKLCGRTALSRISEDELQLVSQVGDYLEHFRPTSAEKNPRNSAQRKCMLTAPSPVHQSLQIATWISRALCVLQCWETWDGDTI